MSDKPRDAWPQLNRVLQFVPTVNDNPQFLTREQVQQYNELGFTGPLDVFGADEIAKHRTKASEIVDEVGYDNGPQS